jgi:hypothetical protein
MSDYGGSMVVRDDGRFLSAVQSSYQRIRELVELSDVEKNEGGIQAF